MPNTNLILMTGDLMNLRTLLEKTPDADLVREMIGFVDHRFMAKLGPILGRAERPVVGKSGRSQAALGMAGSDPIRTFSNNELRVLRPRPPPDGTLHALK